MGVAEAAIAALEDAHALTDARQIGDERLAVLGEHLRAGRHPENRVGALVAGAVLAHAVHAGLGLEVLLVAIVDERIEAVDALHPHVTAAAAVAAVGPTPRPVLLAVEGGHAVAATAGGHLDGGLVDEHADGSPGAG